MATESEVFAVQQMLADSAGAEGWTEIVIGNKLDEGLSKDEIAAEYWESRAAKTSNLVNMSESGSSRSLSDINKSALSMAAYYRKRSEADEAQETVRRARSAPIERV